MTEVLLQEDTDGVRVLTLNRPEARNALNSPLVEALYQALLDADAHDQVLVLTGADPALCAGIDLTEAARAGDGCARAIAEVPADTVRGLKQMYAAGAQTTLGPALAAERVIAARHGPDWAGLEQRRLEVVARNRAQIKRSGT